MVDRVAALRSKIRPYDFFAFALGQKLHHLYYLLFFIYYLLNFSPAFAISLAGDSF